MTEPQKTIEGRRGPVEAGVMSRFRRTFPQAPGRQCSICTHPAREAIDGALLGGEPGRGIARRYSVSEAAVRRHKANHLNGGRTKLEQTTTNDGIEERRRPVEEARERGGGIKRAWKATTRLKSPKTAVFGTTTCDEELCKVLEHDLCVLVTEQKM